MYFYCRRFNTVDKNWREIMKLTIEDRHVLAVIEIENLLDTLKSSNELLDLIQKVHFTKLFIFK